MLFFELFPAFIMLASIPVVVWLLAMDRHAREKPIDEQTTRLQLPRRRS